MKGNAVACQVATCRPIRNRANETNEISNSLSRSCGNCNQNPKQTTYRFCLRKPKRKPNRSCKWCKCEWKGECRGEIPKANMLCEKNSNKRIINSIWFKIYWMWVAFMRLSNSGSSQAVKVMAKAFAYSVLAIRHTFKHTDTLTLI